MAAKKKTYEATLETKKRESTLQLLFKAARLLDEEALARVAMLPDRPRIRRSHTALFPHIDLAGTRVTDLAERVGVTKQAISQLLDDLEALGVVARVPDPADARSRLVVFTDRGKKGLLEGLAVLQKLEADLERAVGADAMSGLREGVVAVVAALDRDPEVLRKVQAPTAVVEPTPDAQRKRR